MEKRKITVNGIEFGMVCIPPGKFLMGSHKDEKGRFDDETPHKVVLTKGFWMAETACTQELWTAVRGNNPSHFKSWQNPVENVSWYDAMRFITLLNALNSDLTFRIPTEAEWEYACRAGTTTPFSFGENITTDQANYDGDYPYAGGKKGEYRQKTVPVKSFPCNNWDLYEMHGNVYELCSDWFGDYPSCTVTDPVGPETGDDRVLRGGSWDSVGMLVRSAHRYFTSPGDSGDSIGFRLAADLKR